uniref:Uncharacterized protein n=1 Tax=Anguilla anguilla TaxID=7936 RepID=A0A0E9SDB9_ANGAN
MKPVQVTQLQALYLTVGLSFS